MGIFIQCDIPCEDCTPTDIGYLYVNQCSTALAIAFESPYREIEKDYAEVTSGDSIVFMFTVPSPPDEMFFLDSTFSVYLTLMLDSTLCLEFVGPILNDSDPRSENTPWNSSEYIYIIKNELFLNAGNCE